MSKNIIEICEELLEIEKWAQPHIQIIEPSQLTSISRNHIRSLCEALKEAHEVIAKIYPKKETE